MTDSRATIRPGAAPLPVPPITDIEPRCWRCDRMLAYLMSRPWRVKCSKCNAINASEPA